jgi:hypothetical protein
VRFVKKEEKDGTISGHVCGQIMLKMLSMLMLVYPFMLEIKMKSKGTFSARLPARLKGKFSQSCINLLFIAAYGADARPQQEGSVVDVVTVWTLFDKNPCNQ